MEGSDVVLAVCNTSARQQWSYRSDGSLRLLGAAGLCLDARRAFSVRLSACDDESKKARVRYDLTIQGNLLPRGVSDLAVAPISDEEWAYLVLKSRTDDASQQWQFDTSVASLQMESLALLVPGNSTAPGGKPRPRAFQPSSPTAKPTSSESSPTPQPTDPASTPAASPCYPYARWYDGGGDRRGDGSRSGGGGREGRH